jgi:RHS repeat-associated protein
VTKEGKEGELDSFCGILGVGGVPGGDPQQVVVALAVELFGKNLDPVGRKITLTYNGEGLVEKAKDPMGHTVKYTYEGNDLKTVTLPGETEPNWQFKYDGSHRMTSMTDGRGGKTTNEYDSSSRVISQTDPAGRTMKFEYASFHTKVTNEATGSTSYLTWDESAGLPLILNDGQNSYIYGPSGLPTEQISSGETPTYLQSGLQYLRGRYYDPATGQFLTTDPIEAQTRQPYSYALDNPLSNVDRSGLEVEVELPCFPFCTPPPIIVEPVEEAANAVENAAGEIFGGPDEVAPGSVTIAPNVLEARSQESDGSKDGESCDRNPAQDKKVTDRELEEADINPHDLKDLGSGSDIYKDREGNLYEKPHGGKGPGEDLGINIKDRFK